MAVFHSCFRSSSRYALGGVACGRAGVACGRCAGVAKSLASCSCVAVCWAAVGC